MDLKIEDVAELLQLSESKIRRLASKGELPAYRLNGKYRFSRNEIEDWVLRHKLEYGEGDENNSKEEETPKTGSMHFSLYRALYRGDVLTEVEGNSKEELIQNSMQYIAKRFDFDPEVLSDLFLDRERLMPTSLGLGIGVPHTRDFLLPTHFDVISVVFPKTPIEYGALDNVPVHTLFFLFACEDKHHLHLLAKLAHLAANEKARDFLSTKPSKDHLLDFVKQWESSIKS